jgi:hypothetical protein
VTIISPCAPRPQRARKVSGWPKICELARAFAATRAPAERCGALQK